MKTHFTALILLAIIPGFRCTDLERTNPLDPKNPDSFRTQVVLAELFVNDSVFTDSLRTGSYPYCQYAETALESLYYEFGPDRLVYAQYHVGNTFHDSLDTRGNGDYHALYLAQSTQTTPLVPAIYINGPANPVVGATSYYSIFDRLRACLTPKLDANSHFTLEGTYAVAGTLVTVNSKLARLGPADYDGDLKVWYIVMEDLGFTRHHFIVRNYNSAPVSGLDAGEVKELAVQKILLETGAVPQNICVIVCLKDPSHNVLQALLLLEQT
jgi:hypothetical protein